MDSARLAEIRARLAAYDDAEPGETAPAWEMEKHAADDILALLSALDAAQREAAALREGIGAFAAELDAEAGRLTAPTQTNEILGDYLREAADRLRALLDTPEARKGEGERT